MEIMEDSSRVDSSPVRRMFSGRSVFITGASGFIGRVLLEKLLRSYVGIERIYILMRPKKNMSPHERLHKQLLNAPIFDNIRSQENGQKLLEKLFVVSGDIGNERLGLSDEDWAMLISDPKLSIVFHSAATVRFDEPLRKSIEMNLRGTKDMIELCKSLPNLIALCHISTAYVNSDMKHGEVIEEKLYPMKYEPKQVLKMLDVLDNQELQHLRPVMLKERPNTYTFTKALAEHLIAEEASELPVAVVRPSIVVAAWKEPLEGWVDNVNGPTGIILAIGKGLLRSMHTNRDAKAEIIPVDVVVNTVIASSYYAAKKNGKLEKDIEIVKKPSSAEQMSASAEMPIIHCNLGEINPITWGRMEDFFLPIVRKYPSVQVLRYPNGTFKRYRYQDVVTRWIVHFLPALLIDLFCLATRKKRQLVSIYKRLHNAIDSLSHFSTTDYNFQSKNIKLIQDCLTHPRDKEELYMDVSSLDWFDFWDTYTLGCRRYVLKEDDSSLEQSRHSLKRALYMEYAYRGMWLLLAIYLFGPMLCGLVQPALSAASIAGQLV